MSMSAATEQIMFDEMMRVRKRGKEGAMSGDICEVVRLDGVEVQKNGIIRDSGGWIIGRADDEWMKYQWRMLNDGVCPCCNQGVVSVKEVER